MKVKTLKMTALVTVGAMVAPVLAQSGGSSDQDQRERYHVNPEAVTVIGYDVDGDGMVDGYLATTRYQVERLRRHAQAQYRSGTNYPYDGLNDRDSVWRHYDRSARPGGQTDFLYDDMDPRDRQYWQGRRVRPQAMNERARRSRGMDRSGSRSANSEGFPERYDFGKPDSYYSHYGMRHHGELNPETGRAMHASDHRGSMQGDRANGRSDDKGRTIRGVVQEMRRFRLSGQDDKRTFARVKTDDGGKVIVNLGPASDLKTMDLSEGDELMARVNKGSVNNRQVLFANRIKIGDREHAIEQERTEDLKRISGKVVSTRTEELQSRNGKSGSHMIVNVRNNDGRAHVVCLGPKDQLESGKIEKGRKISVLARPVRVDGSQMYLAKRISTGDNVMKVSQIDRSSNR